MKHFATAAAPARPASIAQVWVLLELFSLFLLIGFYYLVEESLDFEVLETANIVGPVWLTITLGISSAALLRHDTANLWAPSFWFRVATAIYFGFGSIVPFLVNATSRIYFESFYAAVPSEYVKQNFVVAASMFVVALTELAVNAVAPQKSAAAQAAVRAQTSSDRLESMKKTGLIFLGVGAFIKFGLIMPVILGISSELVAGNVAAFGALSLAGIYLLTVWSLSASLPALIAIFAYVVLEMLAGALMLAKTEVLLPLLVFTIGVVSQRLTLARLIFSAAAITAFFFALAPLVSDARDSFNQAAAGGGQVTTGARLQIVAAAAGGSEVGASDEPLQSGLLRFSYLNAATLAINLYDRGRPGNSFENVLATFIPRILWPDKPILNTGQEFAMLATGRFANNSVSPGLFAEAYWNFGWLGIPMVMLATGLMLAMFSRYALGVVHQGNWLYMPVLFIGLKMGVTPDGVFVGTFLGSAIMAVFMHFGIKFTTLRWNKPQLQPFGGRQT